MFGENKRKLDSKIRWQNPKFKDRLKERRGYRRDHRPLPDTPRAIFLSKIGLGSWLARLITLLIFLFLVYLAFVPNIFFVRHINIQGADPQVTAEAQSITASYLKNYNPWPQKNLLLLNKGTLKNYLLANDQKILAVNSISKKLPYTLNIDLAPRLDEFMFQTASSTNFSVSGDGLVTSEIFLDASGTITNNLTVIKLDNGSPNVGEKILDPPSMDFINQLKSQLPGVINMPVDFYEMSDLKIPDLSAYTQNGPKFIFDTSADFNGTIDRLKLLLSQAGNIKTVAYVDMRFVDRAYLCYINTPCVANTQASSTPATTTNGQ